MNLSPSPSPSLNFIPSLTLRLHLYRVNASRHAPKTRADSDQAHGPSVHWCFSLKSYLRGRDDFQRVILLEPAHGVLHFHVEVLLSTDGGVTGNNVRRALQSRVHVTLSNPTSTSQSIKKTSNENKTKQKLPQTP